MIVVAAMIVTIVMAVVVTTTTVITTIPIKIVTGCSRQLMRGWLRSAVAADAASAGCGDH